MNQLLHFVGNVSRLWFKHRLDVINQWYRQDKVILKHQAIGVPFGKSPHSQKMCF